MKLEELQKETITESGTQLPDLTKIDFNTFHLLPIEKYKKMNAFLYKCGLSDQGRIYQSIEDFLTDVKGRIKYMGESFDHVKPSQLARADKLSILRLSDSNGLIYDNVYVSLSYNIENGEVVGKIVLELIEN